MKKGYNVVCWTKKGYIFEISVKKLKTAIWIMNLPIWRYAKVHSLYLDNRCIYYVGKY